ncbi:MAG: hypothetical protein B6D42_00030 [Anaerolineae bacterium UTCFX5]|jgi:hypothetical protein|nr:MAG: hypothetical protein B6D42_00030 [Anaerolineae bacterium UTCFX5]
MSHDSARKAGPLGVPDDVSQRMYDVLALTAQRLFPVGTSPEGIVKRHVWRNRRYVGEKHGKVQDWRGWSVNLRALESGYSTVYADYFINALTRSENSLLFGSDFADVLAMHHTFVFVFVTSCDVATLDTFSESGYNVRRINRIIHPGILMSSEDFMAVSAELWLTRVLDLLKLQQRLCQHKSRGA